ncbi:MAG TPA: hypothetical protein VK419_13535, partial [Bryobacteraceae bacterium]|nr:hypothetical protein [Bryobacteraceae bacterium]
MMVCVLLLAPVANVFGATFGTVVPIRGEVSDIALDGARGRLYIANMPGYQINVMNTSDLSQAAPMAVPMPPSSLALSPDSRYLVVGEDNNGLSPTNGGFTIFDLSLGQELQITWPDPVLSVAFGAGSQAFVITTTQLLLLNPSSGTTQSAGPMV